MKSGNWICECKRKLFQMERQILKLDKNSNLPQTIPDDPETYTDQFSCGRQCDETRKLQMTTQI